MNSLAHEKSPYLLQHADNPVQWHPWGPAAFARARAEQKPIFLSIGYSTCHWCHVMAHESFENEEIAALLNADFVSIKVDREERPDVDRIYMNYVQAVTGHGGWPLSAWLTPDLKPFYGGTYFPPEDRHGRPGFPSVLRAIARGWREDRAQLLAEGDRVLNALRERDANRRPATEEGKAETDLATAAGEAFEKGFQYFYQSFDQEHGGFGGAPKFPRAANLSFLFRCAALQGSRSELGAEALRMASFTLQRMMQGGIHDHVGGGFHRYSVDEAWHVPHFEKMLYDQAQIALNAVDARTATGDERFAWMARDIFGYVARELTHPDGGFYSAEDADSSPATGAAKTEGAFYVWTPADLAAVLGADAPLVGAHFGVSEQGNVAPASDPHGELTGKNILDQARPLAETARALGISPEQASERLVSALEKLRVARAHRPRPSLDDKIITAWNGLMISALARGHGVLTDSAAAADTDGFLRRAARAAEFLQSELYDEQRGVLYRSYRDGSRSNIEGFAEDYAYLVQGLIDLYEASFDLRWLQWAERLQQTMDATFADEANGGWFNSAAGASDIVLRLKDDYDGAEPAPSSVAVMNLLRLGAIRDGVPGGVETSSYRARARSALLAFRTQWQNLPQAMPQMLCALEPALEPPRHVVLVGDPAAPDFHALAAVVRKTFGRQRTVLAITGESDRAWLASRQPWLAEMKPVAGRAAAYVCEEFTCQAPVTSPEELRRLLA